MKAARTRTRIMYLPLNITEDRLVGSIDIERILNEGVKAFEPGILAEAHRGILYVDEINLLEDNVVDVLLDAAAMGMVTIEREGISLNYPSEFIIIGSMNPEEGELRPQLLVFIAPDCPISRSLLSAVRSIARTESWLDVVLASDGHDKTAHRILVAEQKLAEFDRSID